MNIEKKLLEIKTELKEFSCTLIAVSKNQPIEAIKEAYHAGQRHFGENKVQELCQKQLLLPSDIRWHFIGHLQSNKVKYIAPFVYLIHAVDSFKLLAEIHKQALKNNRTIDCLLQIFIANEKTKFGLFPEEAEKILTDEVKTLSHINIKGLMGMATNTDDFKQVRKEFKGLKTLFDRWKVMYPNNNIDFKELSMGMSGDYRIALEEGSSMIRLGTSIFGTRKYSQ